MINQSSVRFRFFRPSFSKTHIFPKSSLNSRPGQPTKKIVQPWLFIDPSKREFPKKCQIYQKFHNVVYASRCGKCCKHGQERDGTGFEACLNKTNWPTMFSCFFMVFLGTIPTSGLRHICHVWPVMPLHTLAHNLYIFLRVFLQHAMVTTFIYTIF